MSPYCPACDRRTYRGCDGDAHLPFTCTSELDGQRKHYSRIHMDRRPDQGRQYVGNIELPEVTFERTCDEGDKRPHDGRETARKHFLHRTVR